MASIIRFTKLVQFRATTNPTCKPTIPGLGLTKPPLQYILTCINSGDYVDTIYWTALETYISVIVPNLPAIRSLLSHKYPKLFGRETQSGSTDNSRKNYERSHANYRGGPSIKMASKIGSRNTEDTAVEANDPDYFVNKNLNLGDNLKGNVYFGVVAGHENSTEELVGSDAAIHVNTEMKIEERARSVGSQQTWGEDSVSRLENSHPRSQAPSS